VRQERLESERFIATDPRYLVGIFFPYANGFPDGVMPFDKLGSFLKTHRLLVDEAEYADELLR